MQPMLFSRAAVDAHVAARTVLHPKAGQATLSR
jgi:hypothetical protein